MTFNLQEPPIITTVDRDGAISPVWTKWFIKLHSIVNTSVQEGTTANRPAIRYIGQQYFDTTLNKPIWVDKNGTGWIDATGSTV
jgi:hypothetical protein